MEHELQHAVQSGGFIVDVAAPLVKVGSIAQHNEPYDAIILSSIGVSTALLQAIRNMRERLVAATLVVVVVVIKAGDEQKIFVAGADDLLKPYVVPKIIVARLRAVRPRAAVLAASTLTCGNVRLEQGARQAFVDDQAVRLTPMK